jgi:hypothetical protein
MYEIRHFGYVVVDDMGYVTDVKPLDAIGQKMEDVKTRVARFN